MIYLDNAATTPVHPDVLQALVPYFVKNYGNPSGIYDIARTNKEAIENARKIIADSLNASPDEIYFTSGGTEADNWVLTRAVEKNKSKKHIITSKIEHHAILNTCSHLEKLGYPVSYINVNKNGIVDIDELKSAIRPDTALISIMSANNETGVLQPVEQIGDIAKENGIYFHTDAVQAYMHQQIDVKKSHIDMLSASGHKFNAPKGTGFLYIRNGIDLEPFMHGGKQESGHRAGTENVAGIVGMGKAVEIANKNLEKDTVYVRNMRDYLLYLLENEFPGIKLNGDRYKRLPGNININFPMHIDSSLPVLLDMEGVCVSGGSACTTGNTTGSHVLLAMGLDKQKASSALRITIGPQNTMEEMDMAFDKIKKCISILSY